MPESPARGTPALRSATVRTWGADYGQAAWQKLGRRFAGAAKLACHDLIRALYCLQFAGTAQEFRCNRTALCYSDVQGGDASSFAAIAKQGRNHMQFMILIYGNEKAEMKMTPKEQEAVMGAYMKYTKDMA